MQNIINVPKAKPSRLERFGLFYLDLFKRLDTNHSVFDLTDAQITKRTKRITWKGIILSSIVGIVCVFPTVWVDVYFEKYAESHQNHTNKTIHWICVPAIVFSLFGLIWSIPFPTLGFLGQYQGYIKWASFFIAFSIMYL